MDLIGGKEDRRVETKGPHEDFPVTFDMRLLIPGAGTEIQSMERGRTYSALP